MNMDVFHEAGSTADGTSPEASPVASHTYKEGTCRSNDRPSMYRSMTRPDKFSLVVYVRPLGRTQNGLKKLGNNKS